MGATRYTRAEDAVIRQYAGKKTAEEIGLMLGRPKNGVHHRISKLGLSGLIHGEHHWNSKVDALRVSMLHTLLDAGFTPVEVHRMFETPIGISYSYIKELACARHRKRG